MSRAYCPPRSPPSAPRSTASKAAGSFHPRRHPGRVSGSTGPRGHSRLGPSPSPRSGPRTRSGVTCGWGSRSEPRLTRDGRGSPAIRGRPIGSAGPFQTPRHPGRVPGSTGPRGGRSRLGPSPSPQSGPRTKSGVTGGWGRRSEPRPTRDGTGSPAMRGKPIGPAGQFQTRRHPGLVPGSTGPRGDVLASGRSPRRGVDPGPSPG
jgi:hypothetical protein